MVVVRFYFSLVKPLFLYYDVCMLLLADNLYFGVVRKVVEAARSRVFVSQFKVDSSGISGNSLVHQLLLTLVKKADEGVSVEVLLDCILPLRGRSANNAFVALWLKKRHVDVRYLPRNRCQHAKTLIVDGSHLVVGSHNWTVNSLTRNSECSLYLTDLAAIASAEADYRHLFDTAIEFKPAACKPGYGR